MNNMCFSIGDKVIFINESREGYIIGFKNDQNLLIQCDDIDFEVNVNEVIKVTKTSEDFYQKIKNLSKIKKIKNPNFNIKKNQNQNTDFKVRISKDFELDLHIEKIIDNFFDLSNSEILDIQMNIFYKAIFEAYRLKLPFLIIIHGLGKGTLKSKIITFLKENNASFTEESPMVYKGGATRLNLY
tara:strand:- start:900 stop:1454 length:555 start_codon:yes stop_codon:yes gene_type:complete